jgi:hypothetical protein
MVATWANAFEYRIFWTFGFCKSAMDSSLCYGLSRDGILPGGVFLAIFPSRKLFWLA